MRVSAEKTANKGFSLTELMVVVALIGLLAVMGYRGYSYYLAKARDAIRLNDLRNLRIALRQYTIDHGKYPPNPNQAVGDACLIGQQPDCLKELKPYLQNGIPKPPGIPPWASRWGYENVSWEGYAYHKYSNSRSAVLHVTLETRRNASPCEFSTGSWCDPEDNPYAYCICSNVEADID